MTKDIKTTATVVIGTIAFLLAKFGILNISPEEQNSIVVVTVLVLGLFTRDATRVNIMPNVPPTAPPPGVRAQAYQPMPPQINPQQ